MSTIKNFSLKFGLIMFFLAMLILPQQALATELTNPIQNNIEASIIEPNIVVSKQKTITKYYSDYSSIPEVYPYSEYIDGMWWTGYLYLQSTQRSGSGWLATFSGILCSSTY
ncbi:hypothetical protein [Clostridium grantii]|uniref:Uncharacterized protein n=1 Tax=Clostridium grantii DSM 8605 TaxID=1121316 RepID=A0A1M5UMU0_9CLOT|nr:hypothetical protein [Clostridium grantii]SHH64325.1 hypothetical protein SAMN02745207_01832 [Clostridium grantii DSM 8605]